MMTLPLASYVGAAADPDLRLTNAASEPQNWLTHGGTYLEQRYSALDQISTGNVKNLGLAWSLELDTRRGQETTPLVVDGTVYLTTAWSKVVAIDGASGRQLWQFDPKVPPEKGVNACCDVVNRGAAYYDGKIYIGTLDGRLLALDASNGRQLWSVTTTDPDKPYTITGAPRIVEGKVIIGNGGAEFGVRGYVTAYDARNGKQVWRFYTVPGDPSAGADGAASDESLARVARPTWFGHWYRYGGGGTVWDSIVYDPELHQLYIGVGNGSPWNRKYRSDGKGDNLFLASIVALDPATGKYLWHYQEAPGESWDYTATQPIMLATLKLGGEHRKVLMQAPKDGFFYVLDRTNGKLISARNFIDVSWAKGIDPKTGRPIEVAGAHYQTSRFLMQPASNGAHNWYPMSFSPKTGLVYFPAQKISRYYANEKDFVSKPKIVNTGVSVDTPLSMANTAAMVTAHKSMSGALIAWDPVAQRQIWRVEKSEPGSAGTLATAGNLVFEGDPDGRFGAYDAANGQALWHFDAQTGVLGSPISYRIGNDQYVLVVSGIGGSYGIYYHMFGAPKPNGRVLAFKLGGKASLPAYVAPPLAPANPAAQSFDPGQVRLGAHVYAATCSRCHGIAAFSGNELPDLRRSSALANQQLWRSIVIDGVLSKAGMVSFADAIKPDEAEAVRAFVSTQAKALQAEEKSSPQGSPGQR